MSPDDGGFSYLTPLNSSAGSLVQESRVADLTCDKMGRSMGRSYRSTSSKSAHPSWFAPVNNSSPQKNSSIAMARSVHHSRATLPLSPPLSIYSTQSSSRSIEDNLSAEFAQIESGISVLRRETDRAAKRADLECRDRRLIGECNELVRRLPREKKRPPSIPVEDSYFHLHTSSSNSSTERLASGGSRIEDPRANLVSRGSENNGIFSPPLPLSPQRIMKDERREEIGRRTEGTQTEYERRREDGRNKDMRVERYYEDEENDDERRQRRRRDDRVQIVDDRYYHYSPERERIQPRIQRATHGRDHPRRDVHYERGSTHSLDELRREREWDDLSLPSVFSIPSRFRIEPLQLHRPEKTRLECDKVAERRKSPERAKTMNGKGARVDKSRVELMREEKEKKAMDWFPPVIDIDQLRGRKKVPLATKTMLSGEEVKKRIGEERKEMRRGRSVGVKIEKRSDPSQANTVKRTAFVASSQVDGVSHSLGANRQRLLNLIKCNLPLIHQRVTEYLEGKGTRERNVITGLRRYLVEEKERVMKEKDEKEKECEWTRDCEKKKKMEGAVKDLKEIDDELKYLSDQLDLVNSTVISSSVVNQLRFIHSHLLKCAPLVSEKPHNS